MEQTSHDTGERSKAWSQPKKKPDHSLICSDTMTHLKASGLKQVI